MSDTPVLLAFDLATASGLAWGKIMDGRPSDLVTWNLRKGGKDRPARFYYFFQMLEEFFMETHVDYVRYEEPMAVATATRIGVNEETISLLRGLPAIVEVCAVRAGIRDIGSFPVLAARRHLLGQRAPKGEGKQAVMRALRVLGIETSDDNMADAAVGWLYSTAQLNPRVSHLSAPLFARTAP